MKLGHKNISAPKIMANISVLSIFSALFTVVMSAPMSCPNLEDLKPCSCKRVAYGLQIVCANFNSSRDLIRAFSILRDYHVHTVLLHNLSIDETLPTNIFDGLEIKEIRVEKCSLKFSQPAFSGLDSTLYVLNVVQDSTISSIDQFSLAKLTKLNELYVQSNQVKQVKDSWLNNKIPNVHTVVLDYNDINVIQDHAFASLPLLRYISLADNRIKEMKRSMLPSPAVHLTRIDLSYNDIGSLPEDFFTGMPSLREVIVSGNELKTLPEVTWAPVWMKLKKVYLVENQLVCDEKMFWIRKLRRPYELSGNCMSPKDMAGRSLKVFHETT